MMMQKKSSFLPILLGVVFLGLVGWGVYKYVFSNKSDDTKTTDNNSVVEVNNDTNTTTDTPDTTTTTDTTPDTTTDTTTEDEDTDTTDSTTVDVSTFSASSQTVGDNSNTNKYTLSSVTNAAKTGYHNFVFTLTTTSTNESEPYVSAKYNSSAGVVRVTLDQVTKDSSGIGYQKSVTINKSGISKLYHNVSANQSEEIYDIGVTKSTPFKLTLSKVNTTTWTVTVNVKYPGGTISTGTFGSDTFSKELQALDGALAPDSAKILSYSYGTSGGVYTISFNVSGSSNRPIPSASAQYDGSTLVLTFPGVVSDSVYKALDGVGLSNGIAIQTTRNGNESRYEFHGVSKEYKLYGTYSPNQVVFEIRL